MCPMDKSFVLQYMYVPCFQFSLFSSFLFFSFFFSFFSVLEVHRETNIKDTAHVLENAFLIKSSIWRAKVVYFPSVGTKRHKRM